MSTAKAATATAAKANAAATAIAAAPAKAKAKAMGGGAAAGGAGPGLLAMGVIPGFVPPNPFGSVPGTWYCPRCVQWFRGRHDLAEHMRRHGVVWRRGPGRPPGPSAKAVAAAAKPKAMGKPKAKVLGIQSHVMPIASRMSRILTRVTEMRTE